MNLRTTIAGCLAASCLACGTVTGAAAQEDFFKGKTINFVIGFGAGGGTDTNARLVARYFGKHVPGNPTVVAMNLPGAAGMRAVAQLELEDAAEGLTVASFNPSAVVGALLEPEKIAVDFSKTQWLGSADKITRVCYIWSSHGAATLEDLQKRGMIVGIAGAGATGTEEVLLEEYLGVKLHKVFGYDGSSETHLAMERGEVEGNCGTWASIPEEWLREKKVNVFVRFQADPKKGVPLEIPFAGDLLNDPEKLQVLELMEAGTSLGRALLLSKDVPADRVAILRKAFDDTMADPEFLAEAAKLLDREPSPISGQKLQEMVAALYGMSPEIVEAARKLSAGTIN